MPRKAFAGAASATTLSGALTSGSAELTVANATGYPTGDDPFVVVVGRGTSKEEKILISDLTGSAMTVAVGGRGYDGTSAQGHDLGETVEHCIDAGTVDEANAHVNDDTRDDHSQYLNTSRHNGAHTAWVFPNPAAPPAIATAGAAGTSGTPAHSDHTHAIGTGAISSSAMFADGVVEIDGAIDPPVGDPANINLAADPGTDVQPARADHVHELDAAVAGNGLILFGGALALLTDSSLEIVADTLGVKDDGVTNAMIADSAVDTDQLAAQAVTPAKLDESLPLGFIDEKTKTGSNQTVTGTSATLITNMTLSNITPFSSTRRLRIHVFCQSISSATAAQFQVVVERNGTPIHGQRGLSGEAINLIARDDSPGTGPNDYTVTLQRVAGVDNLAWGNDITPSYIEAHDVGTQ